MVIRGAPAIGVAAAMGIALGHAAQQGHRHAAVRGRVPEDLRPDGGHAADGGQPVLGHRADEAHLRRRRAGGRVGGGDPRPPRGRGDGPFTTRTSRAAARSAASARPSCPTARAS
ncbi:MAG: hypothetical protein MZU95_14615 [Desulfomicrobium escambiense]|nr:hypothetical protein [Desulfomicrobium escambiense]